MAHPQTVQVVLSDEADPELKRELGVGTAVRVSGTWVASQGGRQAWEILADTVDIVGHCDPQAYPLQKKRTSLEHLRTIAHLRPRQTRPRSAFAIVVLADSLFFQRRNFL